jgi:hypothetical protein
MRQRWLASRTAPPSAPPPAGRRVTIFQSVIVALGFILVAAAVTAFVGGSRSYLLLPLAVLGCPLVVIGALLDRIEWLRYGKLELRTRDSERP